MKEEFRVLLVENIASEAGRVTRELRTSGMKFAARRVHTKEGFLEALGKFRPDVVISNPGMPALDGMMALRLSKQIAPGVPLVFVAHAPDKKTARKYIKAGAADYIARDEIPLLPAAVARASAMRSVTKKMEREISAMRESAERYLNVVGATSDVLWETNAKERYTFVSARIRDLLGYEPGDLLGKTIYELMLPHEARRMRQIAGPLMAAHRRLSSMETAKVHNEGHEVLLEISGEPFFDSAGTFGGYRGVDHDRRRRNQEEQKLYQSEQLFRMISENSSDLIAVLDLDGKRLYNSPSYETVLGDPNGLRGTDSFFEIHPDDREMVQRIFRETVRAGVGQRSEYRFLLKDGNVRFIESQGNVIRDEKGKPAKVVVVSRDITERRLAERKIRLLAETVASTKDCISITDLDNAILFVNDALAQTYGYTGEELVGKSIFLLRSPSVTPAMNEQIQRDTLKGGWHGELLHRRKDGTEFPVDLWTSIVRNDEGEAVALVGVGRDISGRKRAEQIQMATYRISQAANTTSNMQELYQAIHGIVGELMPANNFYLALYDQETEMLSFPYLVDEVDEWSPPQKAGKSLTGYVLRTREALLASPEVFDSLVKSGEVELVGAPSIDWLGVPLVVAEQPIGALVVQSYTEGLRYGEEEKNILQFVSNQVAMAIDRKRSEEALRENEERYRTIYNNTPVMLHSTDQEDRIISVSDYWLAAMGYERKEVIGRKETDFLTGRSREYAETVVIPEFRRTGMCKDIPYQFVKKSGRTIDVLLSAITEKSASGEATRSLAVLNDITARRGAEEQLERSYSLLRATLESTADGTLVVSNDGKIVSFNQKFLDLWRIPASTIEHGDDERAIAFVLEQLKEPESFLQKVKDLYSHPEAESLDVLEFKDGRIFERYSKPQRIGNESVGRVWSFRDITEQRRAEDELRSLHRAVDQTDEAIFMTAPDGTITYVNSAFEQLYGFTRDEAIGKTPRILKSGTLSPDYYTSLWRDLLAGRSTHAEYENKTKGGRLVRVEQSIKPVHGNQGSLTGFIAVQKDVTERVKAEEERKALQGHLAQAQKIESIGTLAGGIAHDFNNILAIIMGHLSLLDRHTSDPAALANSIEAITKAVQRGANLVRQILTFARKTPIAHDPVDVNAAIRELSGMLAETFPKTVEIKLELEEHLPIITMDNTQMHQALLNLCVNGRDAIMDALSPTMSHGGMLTIRTGLISRSSLGQRFPEAAEEQYVCISVSDTGKGMDDATRQRIFEPFFTTKDPGKGTGLGLAVVYGVVRSHGGFADVESTRGKGTTFTLFFPVPQGLTLDLGREKTQGAESPQGTEGILLVEDESDLLELMKMILEQKGYQVFTAVDGLEAVETYVRHRERIALVLTDLGLPKLDGAGLYQALKEINPLVRVILASGYLDPKVKSELFRVGAKEFVQKPYVPGDMLRKIRQVIDQR